MSKFQDISGNARASELQFQETMYKLGMQLARVGRIADSLFDEDVRITRLTVRFPKHEAGEFLVVVGMVTGDVKKVGFHGSYSFEEALRGCVARLENRTMVWRDDRYVDEEDDNR